MEPWMRVTLIILGFVVGVSLLQFILVVIPFKFYFTTTPGDFEWNYENVSFETEDGVTLRGWYIPAENKTDATVIVGHGYPADKNNVLPYARFLHGEFNLLFFDFRSFGESDGLVTTAGYREQRDVEAAVNWLKTEKSSESRKIGAYGFSMSAATFLLRHDLFDAVVAEAAYSDLQSMVDQLYFYLGPVKYPFVWAMDVYARVFFGVWPWQVSPEAAVQNSSAPIFLIHGAEDNQIPVHHSQRIYANAPPNTTELWTVEDAGHGNTQDVAGDVYREKVSAFFHEQLK